jgi:hypothetical protein
MVASTFEMRRLKFVLASLLSATVLNCEAADFIANPADYLKILAQLKPGDRLNLVAGRYTDGLNLKGVTGASGATIVITGPAAGDPAIFTARRCCNTIQLDGNSYLEVRNLVLDGADGVGVDAVNARNATHDITLRGLTISRFDDNQATVGISTKGPAWNWIVADNRIEKVGTGMYFGNSDGSSPFFGSIIERNVILDTLGYNIEIKHQSSRDGTRGMPATDQRTVIRRNVFSKANNGAFFKARPNLLVGHFPLAGPGSADRYEIYGNFFYQNPGEALFQGEGNIALYDNLFVNDFGDAINVKPHNDRPRTVIVFHNTVIARRHGIQIVGAAHGYTQKIFANAVLAGSPIVGANASQNIVDSFARASHYVTAPAARIGELNLTPRSGALIGAAIDLEQFGEFDDSRFDFDGRIRDSVHRGAYSADGPGSGWLPSLKNAPIAAKVQSVP